MSGKISYKFSVDTASIIYNSLMHHNINLRFGSFDSDDTGSYDEDKVRTVYLNNVSVSLRSGALTNSMSRVDPRLID